ncbi:unnamed protein product [marine sediment metagenome]|uniref:EamA domain-containing protein n=1 Tax=marine sediment metagenome TaxID=412755 RepID=X1SYL9_9ZZZZ
MGDAMRYFYYSLIAMLFYGVAPLFAKAGLHGMSPIQAMAIRSLIVCVALYAGILLSGQGWVLMGLKAKGTLFITLEALSAGLIAHLAYFAALKAGQASRVVPIIAAFPLVAFLGAVWFFSEKVTAARVAGALCIVVGVWLIRS